MLKTNVGAEGVALSGIDWVTLTWVTGTYAGLMEELGQLRRTLKNSGAITRTWKTALASGQQTAALKEGTLNKSKDTGICVISGPSSQQIAVSAAKEVRCTRLDAAVDVYPSERDLGVKEAFVRLHAKIQEQSGGRSSTVFIDGNMGGWTFYHGKGGKGFKLRVYDKGAQIYGKPGLWIRWELQIGRDYATRARDAMLEGLSVGHWIRGMINKYCEDRSIIPPSFTSGELQWLNACRIESENDEKQRMKIWFRTVVVPFTRRFRDVFGDKELLYGLGLSTYYDLTVAEVKLAQIEEAKRTEMGQTDFLDLVSDNLAANFSKPEYYTTSD